MLKIRIEKRRYAFMGPTKKAYFFFSIERQVTVMTFYPEKGDLTFVFIFGSRGFAVVFRREIKIKNIRQHEKNV